jgi:hypothetical protein
MINNGDGEKASSSIERGSLGVAPSITLGILGFGRDVFSREQ